MSAKMMLVGAPLTKAFIYFDVLLLGSCHVQSESHRLRHYDLGCSQTRSDHLVSCFANREYTCRVANTSQARESFVLCRGIGVPAGHDES